MKPEPTAARRGFLRSACRHCLALAALGAGGTRADETRDEALLPARFTRPAIDSDEGGLWAMVDRQERRLRRSSFVIRDRQLRDYLRDVVCRLGGEHCLDVRVYPVRTPQFNASMAPNGMLQVWSGLLLRVDNEAQLAAVLGHELGHYLERDTVERMRALKSRTAAATFLGVFGLFGAAAGLGVLASGFGFSRDQEARADRVGLRLMQRAGYDPREAAVIWDNLLAELKVRGGEDAGKRSPMFASHPPTEERRDALKKLAAEGGGELRTAELERAVAPFRLDWLKEEIQRGQFEESIELLDRKLARHPEDPELLYARGEVRRLRDAADELPLAVADLEHATTVDKPLPESFRSLGLLHRRRAEGPAAAAAFEKYLALAPDAGDAGLIKTYLSELKP